MVQEYKYLGCVVDEYLEYKSMIEARAKAGMKALYAWLQRCRACVGELRRGTFGKLLEMLFCYTQTPAHTSSIAYRCKPLPSYPPQKRQQITIPCVLP